PCCRAARRARPGRTARRAPSPRRRGRRSRRSSDGGGRRRARWPAPSGRPAGAVAELLGEELARGRHPGRGAGRAGAGAGRAGAGTEVLAEVAGGRLLTHDGPPSAGVLGVVLLHGEGVHVDVAVGTVLGAHAAPDAPVLDVYLERVAPADR